MWSTKQAASWITGAQQTSLRKTFGRRSIGSSGDFMALAHRSMTTACRIAKAGRTSAAGSHRTNPPEDERCWPRRKPYAVGKALSTGCAPRGLQQRSPGMQDEQGKNVADSEHATADVYKA